MSFARSILFQNEGAYPLEGAMLSWTAIAGSRARIDLLVY